MGVVVGLVLLYTSWPAPPTIHRGLEWPQFLNSDFVLCLLDCLFSVCLWANIIHFIHFISFISNSKIFAVLAPYTQNIAQGKKNDSIINAVYSGSLHPALHRNGGWPAPPGVTSERRLEGLCIHFLICCLLSVCNIFTTPMAAYHRPNLERAHKVLAQLVIKYVRKKHFISQMP